MKWGDSFSFFFIRKFSGSERTQARLSRIIDLSVGGEALSRMAAPPPPAAAAAAGAAGASPADKGRLTLRRELGRGAFGTVHYATTTDGGERAIKRIRVSSLTSNRHRLNLDREISLMREINHVNIVRLFSPYMQEDGCQWQGLSPIVRAIVRMSMHTFL